MKYRDIYYDVKPSVHSIHFLKKQFNRITRNEVQDCRIMSHVAVRQAQDAPVIDSCTLKSQDFSDIAVHGLW